MLDLKPYSFHKIMNEEGNQETFEAPLKEDPDLQQQLFAAAKWPKVDDCYEYKLVGVNVHQGTANQGHYWSYINTNRGGRRNDEHECKNDSWFEFNDQYVKEMKFASEL